MIIRATVVYTVNVELDVDDDADDDTVRDMVLSLADEDLRIGATSEGIIHECNRESLVE